MQIIKGNAKKMVATPFGAHFSTRLNGVNSKLVCALSRANVAPSPSCSPYIHTYKDDKECPPMEEEHEPRALPNW